MKVGDYVRTDKGFITKIIDFKEHYTKGKRLNREDKIEEVIENYLLLDNEQVEIIDSIDYTIPPCYPTDEELEKIKKHIVKSSPNIIDLIEVGDYVNYHRVVDIGTNIEDKHLYLYVDTLEYNEVVYQSDIKSIVTKEQFEEMKYEI